MAEQDHFDVVIIGSGAGGGTTSGSTKSHIRGACTSMRG